MARRVPIWTRKGVYYYTDPDGRRRSLKTKDRKKAIDAYNRLTRGEGEPEQEEPEDAPPVKPAKVVTLPPPPALPAPQPEPAPEPARAEGGGSVPADPPPDPMQNVGATAAAPAPEAVKPDAVFPPAAAPAPVEADIREIAETLAGVAQLITGALCLDKGIEPAVVSQSTQEMQIRRAMPLARRLAALPIVTSVWAEAAAFAFVSIVIVGEEQKRNGTPLGPDGKPIPRPAPAA